MFLTVLCDCPNLGRQLGGLENKRLSEGCRLRLSLSDPSSIGPVVRFLSAPLCPITSYGLLEARFLSQLAPLEMFMPRFSATKGHFILMHWASIGHLLYFLPRHEQEKEPRRYMRHFSVAPPRPFSLHQPVGYRRVSSLCATFMRGNNTDPSVFSPPEAPGVT